MATKYWVCMIKILKENVPLTFQMNSFWNKMECSTWFHWNLLKKLIGDGFYTNFAKLCYISLNIQHRA